MYDGGGCLKPLSDLCVFGTGAASLVLAWGCAARHRCQRGQPRILQGRRAPRSTASPRRWRDSGNEVRAASWYGPGFHGKYTANGEVYDQSDRTAAHRTLQMPSVVRVTNLDNGLSTVVRVNDRGPYARGRVLDVSRAAAAELNMTHTGTARVRIELAMEAGRSKVAVNGRSGEQRAALDKYVASRAAAPVTATAGPPPTRR
jgi:rare lipoprotein A